MSKSAVISGRLASNDVVAVSPKSWENSFIGRDIGCDCAALMLLTTQYNLGAGTFAPFAAEWLV